MSKREQLIDATFGMIESTSMISGNVKNILYLNDIEERKANIEKVKENLGQLYSEISRMSEALRFDLNEVIKNKKV